MSPKHNKPPCTETDLSLRVGCFPRKDQDALFNRANAHIFCILHTEMIVKDNILFWLLLFELSIKSQLNKNKQNETTKQQKGNKKTIQLLHLGVNHTHTYSNNG